MSKIPGGGGCGVQIRGGFSLVELLVVMAIISMLMTLVLPSLQSLRARAESAGCTSKMRSIGQIWVLYAADHNQRLPPAWLADWQPMNRILSPYTVGVDDELCSAYWSCPSDKITRATHGGFVNPKRSYSINSRVFGQTHTHPDGIPGSNTRSCSVPISQFPKPSETLAMTEWHATGNRSTVHSAFSSGLNQATEGIDDPRFWVHEGRRSNLLFLDFSVRPGTALETLTGDWWTFHK